MTFAAKIKTGQSFLIFLFGLIFSVVASAQNRPCERSPESLLFSGTPLSQARCLLRPNGIGGVLAAELERLPDPLEKTIGSPVELSKDKLRRFLTKNSIEETVLGGSLDEPIAFGYDLNGQRVYSQYFVIHDTSTPNLKSAEFPLEINTSGWRFNQLQMWLRNPVAHVFVSRVGESITTTPFNEPVRKGFGTKFAREILKEQSKGLQLHIELVQPRRSNPKIASENDQFAPTPGFTDEQYRRLALLYICASVRAGRWMIPAYHSAVDAGIKGAHDDPQNFELSKFSDALNVLIRTVKAG